MAQQVIVRLSYSIHHRHFTQRVDMWAVGCILFERITGSEAFDGDWGTLQFIRSNGILAFLLQRISISSSSTLLEIY
jgi:serine/threonine protein kinase